MSITGSVAVQVFYGLLVLEVSLLLDSWFYGTPTVSPMRFVHFNVGAGMASLFGTRSWHWNFTSVSYHQHGSRIMPRSLLTDHCTLMHRDCRRCSDCTSRLRPSGVAECYSLKPRQLKVRKQH